MALDGIKRNRVLQENSLTHWHVWVKGCVPLHADTRAWLPVSPPLRVDLIGKNSSASVLPHNMPHIEKMLAGVGGRLAARRFRGSIL